MDYLSFEKNNMIKKVLLLIVTAGMFSLGSYAQTTRNYIDTNLPLAQELMKENHIPASVILGIAIHESASGTSKIARYLNNHFGVKGSNSNAKIKSSYKGYESVEDSYLHFIDFMHSREAFNKLFEKYGQGDYKNWAKGIQKGGYAHSRTWASQVITLIKKYELFKYDVAPPTELETVPVARVNAKKQKPVTLQKDNS
jgi:flagellum-specific peptidoglycan hydrolase FlgJ